MSRRQRNLWLLLTVLAAVCVVVYALSYIALEPWHILPDVGGDGAKNNFTYLHHSTLGKGYWFDGMNYPYGEHIVYTDAMPLLSVFFASIGNVTVPTALAVLWVLVSMSVVVAIVFISRILLQFNVPPLSAIVFSCLIGIFAPQLLRLLGHYALSYACFVPMVFYWTLRYHRSKAMRYAVWLYVAGVIFAFLHPYYAAMLLVWTGAYTVGYFVCYRQPMLQRAKHTVPLLVAVVGVLLTVALTMRLTDPITDRPVTPFNPMEANTHIKQIFSSSFSPWWQIAQRNGLVGKLTEGGEGYTYPGLVVLVAVISTWVWAVWQWRKRREIATVIYPDGFERIWLFMAALILLFSMGVPFIWNMMWLMEYLSFFKQFRAMGRFSWSFYHIIAVYGVVLLHVLWRRLLGQGKVAMGYGLLVVCALIWVVEVSGYTNYSRKVAQEATYKYDFMNSKNEQTWTQFLQEHQLKGDDFQAVLILSFFHVGSEKLWVGSGAWSNTLGTRAAMQLQLPIVDVMMSRSSWGQTKGQVRTVAGPFADKPLLRDIPNRKPFLLLHFDEDKLDVDQQYLLLASDYLGHFSQCHVYACYPDRIAANDKKMSDSVAAILPVMSGADTCVGGGVWYYEHYDDGGSKEKLYGAGAANAISGDDTLIATIPMTGVVDSQLFEFSVWVLLGDKDPKSPHFALSMEDSNGKQMWEVVILTKESVDNYNMWFRASEYFVVPAGCKQIKCKLLNNPNPSYLAMDELMLRPASSMILSKQPDGRAMVNNHLYKRAER